MVYKKKAKEDYKKTGPKGPTQRTKEYLRQEADCLLDYAIRGVPIEDDNGKTKRSPVYLKSKLCFWKPYSRHNFIEAVTFYENNNKTKEFSDTIMQITHTIENRLFEAGLSKKADSSIVRLGLTANHGRTTERREDKVAMSISEFEL